MLMLDDEGIAGEVIYGDGFVENHPPYSDIMESNGQIFGGEPWPFDKQLAGARAYNRWLAGFCAHFVQVGWLFSPNDHYDEYRFTLMP